MRLRLSWPAPSSVVGCESFFLGAWRPRGPLQVTCDPAPDGVTPSITAGESWFLLSNRSPRHAGAPGLVHASGDGAGALAFRGYVVDPPVHSWSAPAEIARAWRGALPSRPNGVFALARVTEAGRVLELTTDALGMGTLYWRHLDDAVLFASNPRFLTADGDEPDALAWRTRLEWGSPLGDRSLTRQVQRVPAGSTLRFDRDGRREHVWYDLARLPEPRRRVDDAFLGEVEEAFQTSVARCLGLGIGRNTLPLSGGHDSRRLLTALTAQDVPFDARSVRTLDERYRDVEARFAREIARDRGFGLEVVDPPLGPAGVARDRERRLLLDAETPFHTWLVSLAASLPEQPTAVLDGLAGDVLGESGFDFELHSAGSPVGEDDLEATKLRAVADLAVGDAYDAILPADLWPPAADVRKELVSWITSLPPNVRMDVGYLLFRTRRTVALAWQSLIPAGHETLYPYLDLDYLETTLQAPPRAKLEKSLQVACMERFWPEILAYPSSRSVPAGVPSLPRRPFERHELACLRSVEAELPSGAVDWIEARVAPHIRRRYRGSRWSDRLAHRWRWWIQPLLELTGKELSPPVWIPLATETA